MQIKSWQIALVGNVLELITIIFLLDKTITLESKAFKFLISLAGFIPTILLYKNNTRTAGAWTSIIFGVLGGRGVFFPTPFNPIILVGAGLYYFWRKI